MPERRITPEITQRQHPHHQQRGQRQHQHRQHIPRQHNQHPCRHQQHGHKHPQQQQPAQILHHPVQRIAQSNTQRHRRKHRHQRQNRPSQRPHQQRINRPQHAITDKRLHIHTHPLPAQQKLALRIRHNQRLPRKQPMLQQHEQHIKARQQHGKHQQLAALRSRKQPQHIVNAHTAALLHNPRHGAIHPALHRHHHHIDQQHPDRQSRQSQLLTPGAHHTRTQQTREKQRQHSQSGKQRPLCQTHPQQTQTIAEPLLRLLGRPPVGGIQQNNRGTIHENSK